MYQRSLYASYALHNKVVTRECASLVKATHVDFASEWYPEWLCAEYEEARQGEEGRVDGERELDGQLRRHHGGQDQGALEEQLVPVPIRVLRTCDNTLIRLKWHAEDKPQTAMMALQNSTAVAEEPK